MVIKMDTRPVCAFKLKIWSKGSLLYEDVVFSQKNVEIDLGEFKGEELKLVWDFHFGKEEQHALAERHDYPIHGLDSYYLEYESEGNNEFDILYGASEEQWNGLYYAVIKNLHSSCKSLRLMFREIEVLGSLLLLDIAYKEDQRYGIIHYEKSEFAERLLAEGGKKNVKLRKIILVIAMIMSVLFAGWTFLQVKIIGYMSFFALASIIVVGLIPIICILTYFSLKRNCTKVFRKTSNLHAFKLEKGEIVPIEYVRNEA